jgi:23S rRNA pseudoU1915 N3-methylase RlmH
MKYEQLNELVANLNTAIKVATIKDKETKIGKKLAKVYEKVKKHHEDYNKQAEELRIDNASTDDKGVLLLDEKGEYKFSKEGLKKLMSQLKELGQKEFEFTKILVVNPAGLEEYSFLNDWLTGVNFITEEEL